MQMELVEVSNFFAFFFEIPVLGCHKSITTLYSVCIITNYSLSLFAFVEFKKQKKIPKKPKKYLVSPPYSYLFFFSYIVV
jgi:hypothetical protein